MTVLEALEIEALAEEYAAVKALLAEKEKLEMDLAEAAEEISDLEKEAGYCEECAWLEAEIENLTASLKEIRGTDTLENAQRIASEALYE